MTIRMDEIGITSMTTSRFDIYKNNHDNINHNNNNNSDTPPLIGYNRTKEAIINEIIWNFYESFHQEPNYLLIVLYLPMMALAVTANILVIAVVFKYHYMRSVTNYFVVNLSVADLLVTTICMPMAVSQEVSSIWVHSEFMCKFSFYLQGVAVAASVFTIAAMSVDRYLAIRSPMAFRRVFNRRSTLLVIVAVWLLALSIFVPIYKAAALRNPIMDLKNLTSRTGNFSPDITLALRKLPTFYICLEDLKLLGIRAHHFGVVCFVLVYAVPGFVVILAYSMMSRTLCSRKPPFDCDSVEGSASSQQSFRLVRERRRIAWILLLLAILFALCWLPYNVLRLLVDFDAVGGGRSITNALSYCLFLGHANSALNPVVYCFMTRNFRRSVSGILRCSSQERLARRKPRRKSARGTAMINDACGGCNVPDIIAGGVARRGLLRQRKMLPGCGCGISIGGVGDGGGGASNGHHHHHHHAVLALRRTGSTTSGYDSSYTRHSPHRNCYMLRSIRDVPRAAPLNTPPTNDNVRGDSQSAYGKNNGLETSQPRGNTMCTTDEQHCT